MTYASIERIRLVIMVYMRVVGAHVSLDNRLEPHR